ncbi:MAG: nuclear transport factor 2 family protein [Pyrinomonadaceae bacterium]|nr:nuclear transport factor 2 family protein [Pyrinomonadaceae bacterium]
MKHILVVAMLVATSTFVFNQHSNANQKSNDEQVVQQFLNDLYAALGRNDVAALDRLYADDYTFVNESGVLTTKTPRLAAIKSGEMKYESVSFDDVKIRLYGNTAVATYRANVKAQFKGQEITGPLQVTVTLLKIKGHWQVVAAQATRIA